MIHMLTKDVVEKIELAVPFPNVILALCVDWHDLQKQLAASKSDYEDMREAWREDEARLGRLKDFGNAKDVNRYITQLETSVAALSQEKAQALLELTNLGAEMRENDQKLSALTAALVDCARTRYEPGHKLSTVTLALQDLMFANWEDIVEKQACREFCGGGLPECEGHCPYPTIETVPERCPKCGQVGHCSPGINPCEVCGLPTVLDDEEQPEMSRGEGYGVQG